MSHKTIVAEKAIVITNKTGQVFLAFLEHYQAIVRMKETTDFQWPYPKTKDGEVLDRKDLVDSIIELKNSI